MHFMIYIWNFSAHHGIIQILCAHITLPRKHDLKQQQSRANNRGGLTWGMVQRWKINGRTSWFVSSGPGWSSWSTPPNVLLRAHPPSFHPRKNLRPWCPNWWNWLKFKAWSHQLSFSFLHTRHPVKCSELIHQRNCVKDHSGSLYKSKKLVKIKY